MSDVQPLSIYRIYRNGFRIPGEYSHKWKAIQDAAGLNKTIDDDQKRSGGTYAAYECDLRAGTRKLAE